LLRLTRQLLALCVVSLRCGIWSAIGAHRTSSSNQARFRDTGRYPGAINRHHGIGWEFAHVCIDDASRVAFVQVMTDQRKESAVTFLEEAVAYYARLGIRIERVMTDNGSCYRSKRFSANRCCLATSELPVRPEWTTS
jgi:transposase InsO family protein